MLPDLQNPLRVSISDRGVGITYSACICSLRVARRRHSSSSSNRTAITPSQQTDDPLVRHAEAQLQLFTDSRYI